MTRRLLLAAAAVLVLGVASSGCAPRRYGHYGYYGYDYPYTRSVYYGASYGVGPYYTGYNYGYPAYHGGYAYPSYRRSYAPPPAYRAPVEAYRPRQVAPPVRVAPPPARGAPYGGGRGPVYVTPPRPR